jgi:hypothetical protein
MEAKSFLIYLLGSALCGAGLVYGQAVDPDKIDFSTLTIYKDLRDCLKNDLYYLGGTVGCSTNNCLCRASTQGKAVQNIASAALKDCQNLDDVASATSILTSYCGGKGYTAIVSPTVLSTGAFTVTETTTVTTAGYGAYTAYVTQYTSAAPVVLSQDFRYVTVGLTAVSLLAALPVLWLFLGRALIGFSPNRRNSD